ncbi:MAG: hypothetical protein ACRC0L_01890, partial [Angustibacter sp.]
AITKSHLRVIFPHGNQSPLTGHSPPNRHGPAWYAPAYFLPNRTDHVPDRSPTEDLPSGHRYCCPEEPPPDWAQLFS